MVLHDWEIMQVFKWDEQASDGQSALQVDRAPLRLCHVLWHLVNPRVRNPTVHCKSTCPGAHSQVVFAIRMGIQRRNIQCREAFQVTIRLHTRAMIHVQKCVHATFCRALHLPPSG